MLKKAENHQKTSESSAPAKVNDLHDITESHHDEIPPIWIVGAPWRSGTPHVLPTKLHGRSKRDWRSDTSRNLPSYRNTKTTDRREESRWPVSWMYSWSLPSKRGVQPPVMWDGHFLLSKTKLPVLHHVSFSPKTQRSCQLIIWWKQVLIVSLVSTRSDGVFFGLEWSGGGVGLT